MKRLVKLFALGLCCILAFVACSYDYVHITQYTLKNDTSSPITIETYQYYIVSGVTKELLIIDTGGSETIVRNGDTFSQPFYSSYPLYVLRDDIKIEYNSLKRMDTYNLTYQAKRERHYEYVFTDDFFKDNPSVGE